MLNDLKQKNISKRRNKLKNHQIRVHLSSIGYPVLGDPLYGKPKGNNLRLQAYYISFFLYKGKNKQFSIKLPLSGELI